MMVKMHPNTKKCPKYPQTYKTTKIRPKPVK